MHAMRTPSLAWIRAAIFRKFSGGECFPPLFTLDFEQEADSTKSIRSRMFCRYEGCVAFLISKIVLADLECVDPV